MTSAKAIAGAFAVLAALHVVHANQIGMTVANSTEDALEVSQAPQERGRLGSSAADPHAEHHHGLVAGLLLAAVIASQVGLYVHLFSCAGAV